MYIIGLDIGGTKVEAMLLEFRQEGNEQWQRYYLPAAQGAAAAAGYFRIVQRQRLPTQRCRSYAAIVEDMAALIQRLIGEQGIKDAEVVGLGLAAPGSIHPERQEMMAGSSGVFIGQDLTGDLQRALAWQGVVSLENDANCFAWAEAVAGVGLRFGDTIGDKTILGIILGTGVGGGVVIRGRLLSGRRGGAGEWGHCRLFPGGAPCYCGNNGCVERYLSGPGLEAQYHQQYYQQSPERPDALAIFKLAEVFEPMAIAVVKQYQRHLAQFLATLSQCFDPDVIVLGGGVSTQAVLYEELGDLLGPYLFVKEEPPTVVRHHLGDSAGGIGAALLAAAHFYAIRNR